MTKQQAIEEARKRGNNWKAVVTQHARPGIPAETLRYATAQGREFLCQAGEKGLARASDEYSLEALLENDLALGRPVNTAISAVIAQGLFELVVKEEIPQQQEEWGVVVEVHSARDGGSGYGMHTDD